MSHIFAENTGIRSATDKERMGYMSTAQLDIPVDELTQALAESFPGVFGDNDPSDVTLTTLMVTGASDPVVKVVWQKK